MEPDAVGRVFYLWCTEVKVGVIVAETKSQVFVRIGKDDYAKLEVVDRERVFQDEASATHAALKKINAELKTSQQRAMDAIERLGELTRQDTAGAKQ